MNQKKRILVAMSGGIDSSVAAIKLHEAGHEVIGITMKTWNYTRACSTKKQIGCCNLDTINDAREVAVKTGFPYMVLDIRKEFGQAVIDHFKSEYLAGRTPNPCILCNTHIKWEALRKRAQQLGCSHIATGHYAQVRQENGRCILYKSNDPQKDQTYALWGLSQESLQQTIFPLGHLTKPQVRTFAQQRGYTNLIKKSESYEICFIPGNNYREFLKEQTPGLEEKVNGGNFVLQDGTIVGTHKGYPFYTVGQRKGLGVARNHPLYVIRIDKEKNEVVLGTLDQLAKNGMHVHKLNMIKYPALPQSHPSHIKVRYNDRSHEGLLMPQKDRITVHFSNYVQAIAPGQAAVFYEGKDVLGGGWIASSFEQGKEDHD